MNILIVDDHQLFLDGVSQILSQMKNIHNILAYSDPFNAINEISENENLDLVLMDMGMPRMDGKEFLKSLRKHNKYVPVAVLSASEDVNRISEIMSEGVMGFIPKSYSSEQMISAINAIISGDCYLPGDIKLKLERCAGNAQSNTEDSSHNVAGVTRRQREVLKLVAKGHSNKEIALALNLTEHTVKSHIYALFQLLHAKNRSECISNACKIGLIKM